MARVTTVATTGWAHYTLYEALPRVKALGFRQVEIASFSSYCFHFNYGSPRPAELRKMLADLGLKPISLNFSGGRYQAWRREEIDRFVQDYSRKMGELAEVGIPMMTIPFGERNDRPDQEYQLANVVETFDRIGKVGASLGVRLVAELPHLYSVMPRTEQVLWVFDRLSNPNVGVLVDSSHWGIIGYDPDAFFTALGDRLWHVHLRDSMGADTADRNQTLELTPGKGTVDFRKFAQALDRVGYRGEVSLDFEYRDMTLDAIHGEYIRGLGYLAEHGWDLPESVASSIRSGMNQ